MYSRVYIEITNICNMNCSFCHGYSRASGTMSIEDFGRVLDSLEGHTKYIYYHLMGEPLTHPKLPEFIRMAGAWGFKSMITTNGTLLEERGDEILAAGLHKVNISLHSFEEGSEADHQEYMEKVCTFADKASAAGTIVVIRLWNKGCDGGRNDSALEFLKDRLEGEWKENTRGLRVREKLFLEWGDRFEWPDSGAQDYGCEMTCYGMRDHFGILCDGTVVPCCLDSDGVIKLGNVFEEDLGEILSSPRAVAIKEGFEQRRASEDLCRRCGYAQRFK